MNFTKPIIEGLGRYLQGFHAQLVPSTRVLAEYAARDFSKSVVLAPGRMIDQAEDMLSAWRKNDTSQADRPTPLLPIAILAVSKDYVPVTPDLGRQVGDPLWVRIPGDPKERTFQMRASVCEVRAQVVICAPETQTASSIAAQLTLYCQSIARRRFYARYKLAGMNENWPVQLEVPDITWMSVQNDVKNLTLLAGDITLHATVPMLMYPKHDASDADGRGAGTADDPDGYLVVAQALGQHMHAADIAKVSPIRSFDTEA